MLCSEDQVVQLGPDGPAGPRWSSSSQMIPSLTTTERLLLLQATDASRNGCIATGRAATNGRRRWRSGEAPLTRLVGLWEGLSLALCSLW